MRDITLCHPRLQTLAAELIKECEKQGLQIKIGETLRTKEEQDALYAQGRTKPGKKVTNARGTTYSSYHQWGTAFDIYRADGKDAFNDDDGFFSKVGAIGISLGLEWGGNWKSIPDKPHFQLPDWGSSTSGIKKKFKTPEQFKKTWPATEEKQIVEGWQHDAHGWWWQNEDGSWVASDWRLINHHHYLFGANGYIRTGWHRWNPDTKQVDPADGSGDWYYFQEDGDLQGACWHSKTNGAMEVWYVEK